MSREDQTPWWDKVPIQAGGDVIVGQVGDNARGVAIGKDITQILGKPTPDDKQIIEQRLAGVAAALDQKQTQLDAATKQMADFQLKLLKGELTKTDEKETPSASTITQVGDWLLDNVPDIAEALTSLFASPIVGKVVGKAGELAVVWVRRRFGGQELE